MPLSAGASGGAGVAAHPLWPQAGKVRNEPIHQGSLDTESQGYLTWRAAVVRFTEESGRALDPHAVVDMFRCNVLPDLRPDDRLDSVAFGMVALDLKPSRVGKPAFPLPERGMIAFTEDRMIAGHVVGRDRHSSQSFPLDGSAQVRRLEWGESGKRWIQFDVDLGVGWHRILLTNKLGVVPAELGGGGNLVEDAKMIGERLAGRWKPRWVEGELRGWGVDT